MFACMGICVYLAVVEARVSEAAWREIYKKARRVATQWTPRPLSLGWRQIGALRVVQYTLDIETAEGLHIVGDAETLTTAESFVFPSRLESCASRRPRDSSPVSSDDDVLVAVARYLACGADELVLWRYLLGAKTQGFPYHALIVALGMLVEHALPGAAIVYGQISVSDCEQAQRGVASILGEELELPVVVDAERLRRRLGASLDACALEQAIRQLGPPDPRSEAFLGELVSVLRSSPGGRVRHDLEHVVCSCRDLDLLGTGTRFLLHRLVEMSHDVARKKLRKRVGRWGAARAREAFARMMQETGMRLTSMAWDAVEAADLDELAFLCGAICMHTTRWEVHHAVRGVLENRVLRGA